MKTVTFETALMVEDYMPDQDLDEGETQEDYVEDAFELCSEDVAEAGVAAREELREVLGDAANELDLQVEFVEFDSGNWTHAGAIFSVKCQMSDEDAAKLDPEEFGIS